MANNGSAVSSPWHSLRDLAAASANRTAIVQGEETMTFGQWLDRSHAFAAALRDNGLAPGGRVLLWTETSPTMACALTGTWAAGGIPVLMDPRSGPAHFQHALRTVVPDVVVTPARCELNLDGSTARIVSCDDVPANSAGVAVPEPMLLANEPASIVFTSGSTGRPKGVTQSHGNLLRGCLTVTRYLGVTSEDRVLCTVPWSFDYGYGQLLTAAIRGATLILPSTNNPIEMCAAIEQHRPTVLAGVPSVFTYLLRGVSPFRTTNLSSIGTVTSSGGRIPAPILDELFALLPHAQFFLNYGLTETYRTSYLDPAAARDKRTSIGKAIPGVDVAIVREDGSLAAPGEVGEIVHRGDFVFLGYWNDPDATAKALKPDPLAPADAPGPPLAMFTGDLGYRDEEGFLFFTGRRDHQLKSMGVRVAPTEVEELLYESGLVKEAAVVGRKHEMLGDEVCAFVVPMNHVDNAAFQLGQYARRAMSPYMVPRRFFVVTELPKTPNRKIDYTRLRRLATGDAVGGV